MKEKSRFIVINPEKDKQKAEQRKLNKMKLATFLKGDRKTLKIESSHEEESSISRMGMAFSEKSD